MQRRPIPYVFSLALALAPQSAVADSPASDSDALLQQARMRQAVGAYDEAADGLERVARASPAAKGASDALLDAVAIRLALGQVEVARADVQWFGKAYGARARKRSATVSLALAAYLQEQEDWRGAKAALEAWAAAFDGAAALDQRLVAHAMLGRVFVQLDNPAKAEGEYRRVLDLWKDSAAAVSRIRLEGGDDRRLGTALIAEGEALFFFAERRRRRDVESIHLPVFRGPDTRDAVLAHVNTKVREWVQRKRAAIEGTEREYRKILELEPAPPPRWVVAAANRVGTMWGKFVAEFRAAPIPREWKGHGRVPGTDSLTYDDLRRDWYAKLDEASASQKQLAKTAFATCVGYSVKYQYDDTYAKGCREWLTKNYREEYRPLDELLPYPHLLGDTPALVPPLPPR